MKSLSHPPTRRAKAALASASLALAAALITSQAPGETGISLDWRAPAECPGEAQIMANVERLLGSRTARPAEPIEVVASVSRDKSGFRVRIETRKAEAQVRELRGASCAAIANATALILAMMIDPSVASAARATAPSGSSDPPAPAPPSPPPAAPAEAQTPPSPAGSVGTPAPAPSGAPGQPGTAVPSTRGPSAAPPRPSTPARAAAAPPPTSTPKRAAAALPAQAPPAPAVAPRLSFGLMGWAGADVGTLPGPTAGFGVTGLSRYGAQQFELGAGVWLDRSARIRERPPAGGDIGLVAMAAGTCRSLLQGIVVLSPCLALELGVMHASGFGVTTTQHASIFWAALRGGASLTYRPTESLGLVLRLEGVLPLTEPRFLLGGVGEVHQPTPGARGTLGVSYDL